MIIIKYILKIIEVSFMDLNLRIIPNAKKAAVIILTEKSYKVKVDAPASSGKANVRLIEILSDYFKIPKSKIKIKSGRSSRNKIVQIESTN